jgi:hypothetical protein
MPAYRPQTIQINTLLSQILPFMGEGWSVIEGDDYYRMPSLLHTDGRSVVLSDSSYGERVVCTGDTWPRHGRIGSTDPLSLGVVDDYDYAVSITVSVSRSAEQIVGDIKRRLLPRYTDLFEKCKAKLDEMDEGSRRVFRHANALADISGRNLSVQEPGPANISVEFNDRYDTSKWWAQATVFETRGVNLTIQRLPFNQAEAIMAWLKRQEGNAYRGRLTMEEEARPAVA